MGNRKKVQDGAWDGYPWLCCDHPHKVWSYARASDWQVRLLRKPLFRTANSDRVIKSRLVYGAHFPEGREPYFTLSLLGILHGLFGVTLWTESQ